MNLRLLEEPSTDLWEQEISNIVNETDAYDLMLDHLGSYASIIKKIFCFSENKNTRFLSESCFKDVFDKTINSLLWTLDADYSFPNRVDKILFITDILNSGRDITIIQKENYLNELNHILSKFIQNIDTFWYDKDKIWKICYDYICFIYFLFRWWSVKLRELKDNVYKIILSIQKELISPSIISLALFLCCYLDTDSSIDLSKYESKTQKGIIGYYFQKLKNQYNIDVNSSNDFNSSYLDEFVLQYADSYTQDFINEYKMHDFLLDLENKRIVYNENSKRFIQLTESLIDKINGKNLLNR